MKFNKLLTHLCFALLFCASTLSAQQVDHVLNEALIQLKPGLDANRLESDLQVVDGVYTNCKVVRKIVKQLNIYKVQFDHFAINEHAFRIALERHPDVIVAQANHLTKLRQTVPDDPSLNQQWHWVNPNDADVDADLAWDISTGGTTANGDDIVVAVFDDGGDLDHPDLIDNNWINPHEIADNGIDDDGNGYVDDIYGWNFAGGNNNVDGGSHGVQVAGMIGGVGNNANQGTGINWDVKIMNIRYSSIFSGGGPAEDNILEFYAYALDQRERYTNSNGAEGSFVVATNSSWGIDGGDPDDAPLWCGFYDTLGEAGILSCGATANNNVNIDVVGDLPTACASEYMIAVTATNDNDNRTFSGYGATTIDVGAPGEDVYTTSGGGGYGNTSGTSFASPLTAGIIGLIYSAPCGSLAGLAMSEPQLAAEQVRDAIFNGAEMVGNLDGDVVYGRVNAFNSLELIMGTCSGCYAPIGIEASDVLDGSASISWTNPPDFVENNLRYREVGTADWIDLTAVTSPNLLVFLTPCTTYEVQIESICTTENSGFSNSYLFTTEGCCVAPEGLAVNDANDDSAIASWESVFAAESYTIQWRETGAATWEEMTTMDLSFTFENLTSCTVYEAQIKTNCANNATTEYSPIVVFATTGCGACTDFNYCESAGDDVGDEWIAAVVIADINNQTPDEPDSGYSDFTGTIFTTDLGQGQTYDISLTPGHSFITYDEYFKVYIDYNQDGAFNETDELAFDAGSASDETVNGQITVPADAMEGLTRMRVIMRFDDAPEDGCAEYDYGETEDYCVNILFVAPTCDVPSGLMTSNVTQNSANISWSNVTLADNYSINYKALGTTDWINVSSTNSNYTLVNLENCQEYEWQVESLCPNGETSGFSEIVIFTTICDCPIPTDLDTMNVAETTVDLNWSDATNAASYDVRYKQTSSTNWTTTSSTTTNITLVNLEDCLPHEAQVRTICDNSQSDWSESVNFTTVCTVSSNTEIANGMDNLSVFPNPFNNNITSSFHLEERTSVSIEVYSATGQLLNSQAFDLSAGDHNITLTEMEKLSTGLYFISMTTEKGTKVRRAVKQ
ncbi:MAG: S8 family serine peptidase [Saprospiraceae bacterium]